MKKYVYIIALLLLAVGCTEKNQAKSIIGNETPPQWNVTEDYDLTLSMTMIVKIDMEKSYPEQVKAYLASNPNGKINHSDDILAAFSGDQCVGYAQPGQDGLFYLFVAMPAQESHAKIQLKYYSVVLRNIFIASEQYLFTSDQRWGSADEPIVPTLLVLE